MGTHKVTWYCLFVLYRWLHRSQEGLQGRPCGNGILATWFEEGALACDVPQLLKTMLFYLRRTRCEVLEHAR